VDRLPSQFAPLVLRVPDRPQQEGEWTRRGEEHIETHNKPRKLDAGSALRTPPSGESKTECCYLATLNPYCQLSGGNSHLHPAAKSHAKGDGPILASTATQRSKSKKKRESRGDSPGFPRGLLPTRVGSHLGA